jgi:hypothetical protein
MTIVIHLQPGETIGQALLRTGLIVPPVGEDPEAITIPPGTYIEGQNIRKTRMIQRRTTGVAFLNPSDP